MKMKVISEYPDYIVYEDGRVWSNKSKTNGFMIGTICRKGYHKFVLRAGSSEKTIPVHRLVAKAFIPNPDNKPQVNHIDSNKMNNHVSNLEWCTNLQNQQHSWQSGRQAANGVNHPRNILTEAEVLQIRDLLKRTKMTKTAIGKQYGVHRSTIYRIQKRLIWSHI